MQYPEPDDGAWPARVLRNRRMNQVPETENPATPLRFMHQRPAPRSRLPPGSFGYEVAKARLVLAMNEEIELLADIQRGQTRVLSARP